MPVVTETMAPGVLELGDMLAGGIAIQCQIREAALVPDVDEGDTDMTLCGDEVLGEDTESWTLEGELYQDWSNTGVSKWLFDNRNTVVPFTFTPRTAQGLSFAGNVKVRAVQFGGPTREKLTAEFEWPLQGAPVPTWPV